MESEFSTCKGILDQVIFLDVVGQLLTAGLSPQSQQILTLQAALVFLPQKLVIFDLIFHHRFQKVPQQVNYPLVEVVVCKLQSMQVDPSLQSQQQLIG